MTQNCYAIKSPHKENHFRAKVPSRDQMNTFHCHFLFYCAALIAFILHYISANQQDNDDNLFPASHHHVGSGNDTTKDCNTVNNILHSGQVTTNDNDASNNFLSTNTSGNPNENCSDSKSDNINICGESRISNFNTLSYDLDRWLFYLKPVLFIGGTILNIMGLRVFLAELKRDKSTTFNILLLISSTASLVLRMIHFSTETIPYYDFDNTTAQLFYAQNALMAINSFIAVAFPFYLKRFVFAQHPKLCILVFNTLVYSFSLFAFRVKPIRANSTGGVYFVPSYTEFARQNMRFVNGSRFLGIVSMFLIPIPLTITFFILTLVALRRSAKSSKALSSNENVQQSKINHAKRLTRVFLIIIFIQIISSTPIAMVLITSKIDADFKASGAKGYITRFVQILFGVIVHISQPTITLIFLGMSTSFRATFIRLYEGKTNTESSTVIGQKNAASSDKIEKNSDDHTSD